VLEFCYKCYPCDLYFYSLKKLEQFARTQSPEAINQPEVPANKGEN
jgi:hypothetical protein